MGKNKWNWFKREARSGEMSPGDIEITKISSRKIEVRYARYTYGERGERYLHSEVETIDTDDTIAMQKLSEEIQSTYSKNRKFYIPQNAWALLESKGFYRK